MGNKRRRGAGRGRGWTREGGNHGNSLSRMTPVIKFVEKFVLFDNRLDGRSTTTKGCGAGVAKG